MPKHYPWHAPLLTEEEKQRRHREASKEYAREHAEWNRQRVKEWRLNNPDKTKSEEAKERRRGYTKTYRERHPEKIKAYSKRYYMEKGQQEYRATRHGRRLPGGLCDLCGKEETALARGKTGEKRALQQDHCHTTGAPRGLLCLDCNRGLGAFKDDSALMRRAAEYVDSYQEPLEDDYQLAQEF